MRFAVLAVLLLSGCPSGKITVVQNDPAPTQDVIAACSQACARAKALCGLGGDCVDNCQRDQMQGVAAELNPQCVIEAGTTAAMRACGVPCADAAAP